MDGSEITVPAIMANIEPVTDFVDRHLAELACAMRIRLQIKVAIDELFGNIARYAYRPNVGPATVRVQVEQNPLSVVLTFIDKGKPYDPLSAETPDITLPASQRRIGGLGIFMVRKSMDDIEYAYRDGQNILTIRKQVEPQGPGGPTGAMRGRKSDA